VEVQILAEQNLQVCLSFVITGVYCTVQYRGKGNMRGEIEGSGYIVSILLIQLYLPLV